MKSVSFLAFALLLFFFAPKLASASSVVPEPGHYGGGIVTFTLTTSGEIHNLRFRDRLVAHNAGELKGRHFIFRHRTAVFVYHGEIFWHGNPDQCTGTINTDIPSARYYGPAESWHAHLISN